MDTGPLPGARRPGLALKFNDLQPLLPRLARPSVRRLPRRRLRPRLRSRRPFQRTSFPARPASRRHRRTSATPPADLRITTNLGDAGTYQDATGGDDQMHPPRSSTSLAPTTVPLRSLSAIARTPWVPRPGWRTVSTVRLPKPFLVATSTVSPSLANQQRHQSLTAPAAGACRARRGRRGRLAGHLPRSTRPPCRHSRPARCRCRRWSVDDQVIALVQRDGDDDAGLARIGESESGVFLTVPMTVAMNTYWSSENSLTGMTPFALFQGKD